MARRAGKVILGYDSILKSTRVCKILIVASDISERTKKNIYNLNINVMESGLTKSELGRLLGCLLYTSSDLLGGKPADGGGPLGSLRNVVIAGAHDIVHIGGVCRRRFRHRVGIKSDDILVQEGLVVLLLADNDIGDSARQSPIGARAVSYTHLDVYKRQGSRHGHEP